MEEGQALRERSFAKTALISAAGLAIAIVLVFAILNVDRLEHWNADLGEFLRSRPLPLPVWFLIAFAAGVITSLTPCVYPVVPLAVTYLGARGATSRIRAFSLAAAYVAGMVACYTALGAAAGLAGTAFGTATQKWWVYAAVATIVLLFGLSMLGLFSIRLPSSVMALAGKGSGPGYKGAVLMGATSGLVTAPCTAPVLGTLLSLVSSKSVALGSVLLAVFGLGMGMLFLLVGTYSGVLASMPRSGRWMNVVKTVLGTSILLVSAYFFYQAWLKLPAFGRRAGEHDAARSDRAAAEAPDPGEAPDGARLAMKASWRPNVDSIGPGAHPTRAPISPAGESVAAELRAPASLAIETGAADLRAPDSPRDSRSPRDRNPRAAAPRPAAETKRPAPPFSIVDIRGRKQDLAANRGKTVHLVFFAVWCPPCVAELRRIETADARLRGRGYRPIIVAMKDREDGDTLRAFAATHQIELPLAWDATGEVAAAYAVGSIPMHVIIGPDGVILYAGRTIPEGFERDGAGLVGS